MGRRSDSSDPGGSQASCPRRSPGPRSPGELLLPHSVWPGASRVSPLVPWAGSSGQYWSCMYCSTSVLPSGSLSSGGAAAGHLLLPLHLHQPVELHGGHGVFYGRVPVLAHLRTRAHVSLPAVLGGSQPPRALGPGPGTCTLRTQVHSLVQ